LAQCRARLPSFHALQPFLAIGIIVRSKPQGGSTVNSIIYLIGLIVVIMLILSLLGLR